jgi:amino acid transporter
MSAPAVPQVEQKLIRAIGVPSLAANIINTTIGAGIFVIPATVSGYLGAAAPLAFLICAVAMGLIVTSFAIAGSRVALTGGLYAYVEVAFGRYIGFLAGVLLLVTVILSVAGVASVFANSVGILIPILGSQIGHVIVILVTFALLAFINVSGVRAGARAVGGVTIVKLLPLIIFVAIGLFFIEPAAIAWPGWPGSKQLGDSVLLLIFAFAGIEVGLVPSGEVKDPARTVPRAVFTSLLITTALYVLIQLVAQGVLGNEMARHKDAPLAEAAARFLGDLGRTLILAGATISAFGFVTSDILSSPRVLFAFGRDRVLPGWFAHVHPRFRTPDVAIIVYAAIAVLFSTTSTFEQLAILANVAVLLLYILCCLAALQLMRRDVRAGGRPFNFPGAPAVPVLALIVIVWILAHATAKEFAMAAIVLGIASVLFLFRGDQVPNSESAEDPRE